MEYLDHNWRIFWILFSFGELFQLWTKHLSCRKTQGVPASPGAWWGIQFRWHWDHEEGTAEGWSFPLSWGPHRWGMTHRQGQILLTTFVGIDAKIIQLKYMRCLHYIFPRQVSKVSTSFTWRISVEKIMMSNVQSPWTKLSHMDFFSGVHQFDCRKWKSPAAFWSMRQSMGISMGHLKRRWRR